MSKTFSILVRGLLVLTLGLGLVGCTSPRDGRNGPQSNGEGILGRSAVANLDNYGVRCHFTDQGSLSYGVECFVVVFDTYGELLARSFAANLTPTWKDLEQVLGPTVSQLSCSYSPDSLRTTCNVVLSSPVQVQLASALVLTDTKTSASREEVQLLDLPYSARSLFRIPHLSEHEGGGESNGGSEAGSRSVRAARTLTSTEESLAPIEIGAQTRKIPLNGFPMHISSAQSIGSTVFLFDGSRVYRLMEGEDLRIYLGGPDLSGMGPSTEDKAFRLRRSLTGGKVLATPKGLVSHTFDSTTGAETLSLIPDIGEIQTLAQFSTAIGDEAEPILGGVEVHSLAQLPDGSLLVAGQYRVSRFKAGVVSNFAGVGREMPNPHTPTSDPNSLAIHISKMIKFSDGRVVFLASDRVTGKQQLIVIHNQSYKDLLKPEHLEEGWWFDDIAISQEKIYGMKKNGRDAFRIVEIDGETFRTLFTVPTGQHADCSGYPEARTVVPVENFPFGKTYEQFTSDYRLGGKTGVLISSHCGLSFYRPSEGLVQNLMRTIQIGQVGLTDAKASTAYIYRPRSPAFLPNGDLMLVATNKLHTISLNEDKIESVRLMTGGYLYASPSGGRYVHWNYALYRIQPDNTLVRIHVPTANWTSRTQFAFESDEVAYFNTSTGIHRLNLIDRSLTQIVTFPTTGNLTHFRTRLLRMAWAAQGLFLINEAFIARVTSLQSAPTLELIGGGGTKTPEDGLSALSLTFSNLHSIAVDSFGGLYISEAHRFATLTWEPTGYVYSTIFPTKISANCSGSLSDAKSGSFNGLLQLISNLCPTPEAGQIALLDRCSQGGNILIALVRTTYEEGFGSALLLTKNCPL